jgi:hypothetical protein
MTRRLHFVDDEGRLAFAKSNGRPALRNQSSSAWPVGKCRLPTLIRSEPSPAISCNLSAMAWSVGAVYPLSSVLEYSMYCWPSPLSAVSPMSRAFVFGEPSSRLMKSQTVPASSSF